MRPLLRFSAANLALGYVAASLAALAVFATPLWFAWRSTIDARRGELLQEDERRLVDIFQARGADGLAAALDARVARSRTGGNYYVLADRDRRRMAGNLSAWPDGVPEQPGRYRVTVLANGEPRAAIAIHELLPGGYRLLVAGDDTSFQRMERLFWYGLAATAAAILALGAFAAWAIRREFLREVQRIQRTAAAIVAGDLSRRVESRGVADDLELLSRTVNGMLDRIQALVDGVRNVSNAIAHDLRTPLAELRSRLEELAMSRLPAGEAAAELESAVADVDRVIAIFNALLRLAEIDSGMRRSGFARVDLGRVAAETAEFYEPVAEEKGIALSCRAQAGLEVMGDSLLLAQALGNLVDNAIKYAPAESAVEIRGVRRAGLVELSVADRGPGIPDAEKPRVVERFYRGDRSRGAVPGMGLGLALVAGTARLHGGAFELSDHSPGLVATLRLPRADPAH
ncbi:MAG TPA: ATP-binding protein [Usitatibacter sp.]|nr:ATP-binding protein [Usitatibacter sp.]